MKRKIFISLGSLIGVFIIVIIIGSFLSQSPAPSVSQLNQIKSTELTSAVQTADLLASTQNLPKDYYTVSRVVDGDTIKIKTENGEDTVRLIGINTPETVDPRKSVECFGIEASNKAKSVLTGQSVRLESDPSQDDRDKYGRLLRYPYLSDGTSFDLMMIQQGYAYEYTYNVPYKYQAEYKAAQKVAEENKLGLWADSACGVSKNDSAVTAIAPIPSIIALPTTSSPVSTGADSGQCLIKGTISSSGEKIYHIPGCASYNVTKIDESKGERYFCSESEAVTFGWRKALNCPK